MSDQTMRGISRAGLDAAFEAEETRKSNLIIEGQYLRLQRDFARAAGKMAAAAEIEEQLATICEEKGLVEKAWVHWVSAVNAWSQAGNFYEAFRVGEVLLSDNALPERLRQHLQGIIQAINRRWAQWTVEPELAAGKPPG